MWQSLASLPRPLRTSRASGLVVEACVALLRRSPWKSRAALRPPPAGGYAATCGSRPEALHAGEGLDQRAVDREVLVRKQRPDCGLAEHRLEEPGGDVARQEPLAVLGEHRDVPDRRIHRQPDEPAEQQIVIELFDQLALRTDRVEGLQQKRPQQLLRRDRWPPICE
jgi:hypothetical protein